MIDPFDLAVLTSHIQANSSKAIQKSSILHGSLIASSGALQGMGSSKQLATSTTNEKHNIIRLAEVTARFSMLPTPTINTKASVRQVIASKQRTSAIKADNTDAGLTSQVFNKIGGLSSWFGKE